MYKISVLGVGNMAKAIIGGVVRSGIDVSSIVLFDKNQGQYADLEMLDYKFIYANCVSEALCNSDIVLLSVKPQNYDELLSEITSLPDYDKKTYISIAAGLSSDGVSKKLNGAKVVRVLPNLPMVIGSGVSLVCKNDLVDAEVFEYICSAFGASGGVMRIDESEIDRMISVTSSSPAYVFRFVDAIYKGAVAQGLEFDEKTLIAAICDVIIGSALLLKNSSDSPSELCSKVASKGGTTEQALKKLDELDFESVILQAMLACTKRANELGAGLK
jgi:pyrroline-5-carboxylate reductase